MGKERMLSMLSEVTASATANHHSCATCLTPHLSHLNEVIQVLAECAGLRGTMNLACRTMEVSGSYACSA